MEVGFDAIETVIENDKIVCMSGAKVYEDVDYNRFLRVNMFYYILKAHRAKYNGIVYLDQGFFDRHINFAKATRCKGLFFSIYAHSSKLKAMVINHTTRRISSVRSKLKHWDNLQHLGQCQFNNVQQEFFYFPLSIKTFNPSRLITWEVNNTMQETHIRTIARMISYRITAWLFTLPLVYVFVGDFGNATGFTTLLHILLSIDYYLHERVWLKIKWGTARPWWHCS